MGKSQFIDLKDQSGRIQAYAQKQTLGDEQFDIFRHLDLGDFIGAKGTMFTTKTGEISVKLSSFMSLAKALRPPPENGMAWPTQRFGTGSGIWIWWRIPKSKTFSSNAARLCARS